jgi:hypothetical protein
VALGLAVPIQGTIIGNNKKNQNKRLGKDLAFYFQDSSKISITSNKTLNNKAERFFFFF